jgi:hypothetical protein
MPSCILDLLRITYSIYRWHRKCLSYIEEIQEAPAVWFYDLRCLDRSMAMYCIGIHHSISDAILHTQLAANYIQYISMTQKMLVVLRGDTGGACRLILWFKMPRPISGDVLHRHTPLNQGCNLTYPAYCELHTVSGLHRKCLSYIEEIQEAPAVWFYDLRCLDRSMPMYCIGIHHSISDAILHTQLAANYIQYISMTQKMLVVLRGDTGGTCRLILWFKMARPVNGDVLHRHTPLNQGCNLTYPAYCELHTVYIDDTENACRT